MTTEKAEDRGTQSAPVAPGDKSGSFSKYPVFIDGKGWLTKEQAIDELSPEIIRLAIAGTAKRARESVLKELQLWRYKAMNGVLKKDVWQIWNRETDVIDELRVQNVKGSTGGGSPLVFRKKGE